MSINRVTITGNLTRDPELKATSGGSQVLRLGVAVNDRWFNQQTQQWEDRPNYVDCTLFGKRAGAVAPYLRKGTKVAIEGKLRWSQWQDKSTGQNRSKLEVNVDDIEFMSGNKDGGNGQGNVPAPAPQPSQPQRVPAPPSGGRNIPAPPSSNVPPMTKAILDDEPPF